MLEIRRRLDFSEEAVPAVRAGFAARLWSLQSPTFGGTGRSAQSRLA